SPAPASRPPFSSVEPRKLASIRPRSTQSCAADNATFLQNEEMEGKDGNRDIFTFFLSTALISSSSLSSTPSGRYCFSAISCATSCEGSAENRPIGRPTLFGYAWKLQFLFSCHLRSTACAR